MIDFATQNSAALALTPTQWIGIPIAIVGAVFMSLGALYQQRGVRAVEAKTEVSAASGLNGAHLRGMLTSWTWIAGSVLLGLAIVLQLVSYGFSPLILVQPLGIVALVVTAFLNVRITKTRMSRATAISIGLCVFGIAAFVAVAAFHSVNTPITDARLITVLVILVVVLVLGGLSFVFLRRRMNALAYVLIAGVVYGFIGTLGKTVIARIIQGNFDWLTVLGLVGLGLAAGLGTYFVQNAYASGPTELVLAGLTVIDPLVAVLIGIAVLGEAQNAPLWVFAVWTVLGIIAVAGVFGLAKSIPPDAPKPPPSA